MRKHLMDRHKQWIMKGWHAMCLRNKHVRGSLEIENNTEANEETAQ